MYDVAKDVVVASALNESYHTFIIHIPPAVDIVNNCYCLFAAVLIMIIMLGFVQG